MAENNKTRFFYVLYSDKTRVFDQSERAYYPIYIIILNVTMFWLGADCATLLFEVFLSSHIVLRPFAPYYFVFRVNNLPLLEMIESVYKVLHR